MDKSDPMTDANRPIAFVDDDQGNSIVLKCDQPGKDSVYASAVSVKYLGWRGNYDRERTALVRFDSTEPVPLHWWHNPHSALMSPDNLNRNNFFRWLRESRKLAIRFTAYDYGTVDMVFDVTGSAEEVDRVFALCKDTLPSR